ncbi:MAG: TIGR04282 family arsenosugar biosynthesis glycosyltransferase [Pseudolabrys sp.]
MAAPSIASISVLAKAPVPGFAKTRLIPDIGAHAAAVLQERLTARAVTTALAAGLGRVTLWCAPDMTHRSFLDLKVALRRQPEGDLGDRMLAAFGGMPTLVIGTDCPALTPAHLREAAEALERDDVVLIPAEDGGYVLIGAKAPHPALFADMTWSVPTVLAETRARIAACGLSVAVLDTLWDVDIEPDLARMERAFPELAL